jgi:hypothetical protein
MCIVIVADSRDLKPCDSNNVTSKVEASMLWQRTVSLSFVKKLAYGVEYRSTCEDNVDSSTMFCCVVRRMESGL